MQIRHLTIRKCGRLLKIEIRNLNSPSQFGGSRAWGKRERVGWKAHSDRQWCAGVPVDQHTHSFFPPRTPLHSYGAPGDREEESGCPVLGA